jgi:hypothetical protein
VRWGWIKSITNRRRYISDIRRLSAVVQRHPLFPTNPTLYPWITTQNSNLSIKSFLQDIHAPTPELLLEHFYTLLNAARKLGNINAAGNTLKVGGLIGAVYGVWKIICPILSAIIGHDLCSGTIFSGAGFEAVAYIFGGIGIFFLGSYLFGSTGPSPQIYLPASRR